MESAAQEMIIWNGIGIFENDLLQGHRDLVLYLAESNSNVIADGGRNNFAINKFSNMSNFIMFQQQEGLFRVFKGSTLPSIEALDVK